GTKRRARTGVVDVLGRGSARARRLRYRLLVVDDAVHARTCTVSRGGPGVHGVSITTLVLVAVGSTSLLLGVLGFALFARRRTSLYGWFSTWMAVMVVYSIVRIGQMTGVTDSAPSIASRIIVAISFVASLATMRFACAFVERPIHRLETIVTDAF